MARNWSAFTQKIQQFMCARYDWYLAVSIVCIMTLTVTYIHVCRNQITTYQSANVHSSLNLQTWNHSAELLRFVTSALMKELFNWYVYNTNRSQVIRIPQIYTPALMATVDNRVEYWDSYLMQLSKCVSGYVVSGSIHDSVTIWYTIYRDMVQWVNLCVCRNISHPTSWFDLVGAGWSAFKALKAVS